MTDSPTIFPLGENAHVNFPKWYRSALAASTVFGAKHRPHGLLSDNCTDAYWKSIPSNKITAADGTITYEDKPLNTKPDPIAANASGATVAIYNRSDTAFLDITQATVDYKKLLITSVGDYIQDIEDAIHGTMLLTTLQIINKVTDLYGTISADELFVLKTELSRKITSDETYQNIVNRHRHIHSQFVHAEQSLSEFDKVDAFTKALSSDTNISASVAAYYEMNPVTKDRTFAKMDTYLRPRAPTSTTLKQGGYAAHAIQLPPIAAVSHLPLTMADLTATVTSVVATAFAAQNSRIGAGRGGGRGFGRGSRGRGRGADTGRGTLPRPYCYLHGYTAHTGAECRDMNKNLAYYTPAYLAASDPSNPIGGSVRNA